MGRTAASYSAMLSSTGRETKQLAVALALFAYTAIRFRNMQRRKRNKEKEHNDSNVLQHVDSMVGVRGHQALQPAIPYLAQFLSCMKNMCDPVDNASGYIPLCVAENRLIVDMLAERFMQVGTATAIFSDPHVYFYNSFLGMPVTREAAAYFLARRFLFPEEVDLAPDLALRHIRPNHVAIGGGGAALLNNLFFLLGDKGDSCLIPRPYYAAFETDIKINAGIETIGVAQADPVVGPTVDELDVAYQEAVAKGTTPKFILLTNPNNPLGTIYSVETMLQTIQWARKHKMHTIVDEIYALGTHSVRRKYRHLTLN
jgi:aspartate/methionine/tyrosine aminotransferase